MGAWTASTAPIRRRTLVAHLITARVGLGVGAAERTLEHLAPPRATGGGGR
jgi:hypothetical protein